MLAHFSSPGAQFHKMGGVKKTPNTFVYYWVFWVYHNYSIKA